MGGNDFKKGIRTWVSDGIIPGRIELCIKNEFGTKKNMFISDFADFRVCFQFQIYNRHLNVQIWSLSEKSG